MTTSAMKRKHQHDISHLYLKEKKQSHDEKTPTEFNDMCDNVIDLILCHLQLEDLANVSDTSKRLKNIAGSVFSRRHGHRLISFDAFHHSHDVSELEREIREKLTKNVCKNKAIVRIHDAKIWFKLMRNFGGSIQFMRIECVCRSNVPVTNIPIACENLIKYVFEYCSDSLEVLELNGYPFFPLNKPLSKLRQFFSGFVYPEVLELMPNLRCLRLNSVPKTLEKYFPQLERIFLRLDSDEEVHSLISFLGMNRQIKYLYLELLLNDMSNYYNLIYSSIVENLTQLEIFKIYSHKKKLTSTYRFKSVKSFLCCGESFANQQTATFEFEDLTRLTVYISLPNFNLLSIVLRNKKLKILKLVGSSIQCRNKIYIRKLLSELPELEKIIVNSPEKDHLKLKKILGNEWKQIQMKEVSLFKTLRVKSKFQRIK